MTDTRVRHKRTVLRVREIRHALEMTQRDFAYYLQVAVPTVSNWETGRTQPSGLAERAIRDMCAQHGLDLNTMRSYRL